MIIKASIELEVENLSRHQLNNMLSEAMADIYGFRVAGPYTDAEGNVLTDDFFVSDEIFAKTAGDILRAEGFDEEKVKEFVKGEKVLELHRAWNEYVSDTEDFNYGGREKFKELAVEIFNS